MREFKQESKSFRIGWRGLKKKGRGGGPKSILAEFNYLQTTKGEKKGGDCEMESSTVNSSDHNIDRNDQTDVCARIRTI